MPERTGEIWYEHWHRYALVRQLAAGCAVLDVACGEGYGSSLVAEAGQTVVGVDISEQAVGHARSRYGHQKNLQFIVASCDRMPFEDASFDLVVSFETIEHIHTQNEFVAEITRVLRPDGLLIMSSPNKRLYSDAHDYHNEFHVRELYRDELEELLKPAFPHISWFGQKLLFHSVIWPESAGAGSTEYLIDRDGEFSIAATPSVEPMYYLVACSRNPAMLPAVLNKVSMFSDTGESVYRDYATQTRRVLELDGLLIDRERLVAERDEVLAERTQQMRERENLIAERDALLALRTTQLDERAQLIAERDALLNLRTQQMEDLTRQVVERDKLLSLRTEQMVERERLIAERDAGLAEQARLAGELHQQLAYRESFKWWLNFPIRFVKRAFGT
ncbi:hypothetical protein BH11PSE11_BH11PSE11_38000 [soil metagenome]